jgi:hypothetical protein
MTEIFIQRQFELANGSEVFVRFYRPAPDDDDFRCNYEITWPDRKHAFHAIGIDEVQALILAIQMAHVKLLSSPEAKRGELTWLGTRDLGLPIASSVKPEDFT